MASSVSQITICNNALLKIGSDVISSLDQGGQAATVLNAIYAVQRDACIRESNWRFATKRVVLYPNATTPAFTYTYQYDIPSDCIRPFKVIDDSISWIVEGNQILTDESSLDFIYFYQNTDESSWDPCFADAFAWRLARELALSMTESTTMYGTMDKGYKESLAQARAMNAIIGTIPALEADIWSSARRGDRFWRKSAGQTGDA